MFVFIDDIMGSGKSTALINKINRDEMGDTIYATPYLNEVERFVEETAMVCPEAFTTKEGKDITKGQHFNMLLDAEIKAPMTNEVRKNSIAMSHSLLRNLVLADVDVAEYTLVLDEVMSLCEPYSGIKSKTVIKGLAEGWLEVDETTNLLSITDGTVRIFEQELKEQLTYIDNECVYWFRDSVVILQLPLDFLRKFKNVVVMSYLVEGSWLFQMLTKEDCVVKRMVNSDMTDFAPYSPKAQVAKAKAAYALIDVVDHRSFKKMPKLSVMGTSRLPTAAAKSIGKTVSNWFTSIGLKSNETMHSSFANKIVVPSHKAGTTAFNIRATNDYSHTTGLAYLVERHTNPMMVAWDEEANDIEVNDEHYNLDCMVQWIFRSAIRNGQPVKLFLPSDKMRKLLKRWGNGDTFLTL